MRKLMALLVVATFGFGLLGCNEPPKTTKDTVKDTAKEVVKEAPTGAATK